MAKLPPAINFKKWIDDNRHLLKPPVGNKAIYNEDYIVMVVGGPNSRKDYHLNKTPEFFYQVEGDIILKVVEDGVQRDIEITVGLVIEQRREDDMEDGLAWFCEECHNKLYEEPFVLQNIEKDLPVIFDKFYSNEDLKTCDSCGAKMQAPS